MREEKVGKVIKGLSNEIGRFVAQKINDDQSNFTMNQFHFISFIGRESLTGPVYQRDLEANFNIRRSTATGILQRLEKNQFITREPSPADGRLKHIQLTATGKAIFETKKKKLDQINDFLVKDIPADELKTFYHVIEQIYINLGDEQLLERNEDGKYD